MWRVLKGLVSSSFLNHNPSTFCVLSVFWYIAFRYLRTVNPTVKSSYHNIDQIISKQWYFFRGEILVDFLTASTEKVKIEKRLTSTIVEGLVKVEVRAMWKCNSPENGHVLRFQNFLNLYISENFDYGAGVQVKNIKSDRCNRIIRRRMPL